MSDAKKLRMHFDPQTIEHLGLKMYSNIPTALAELVANAYDADAKTVSINLFDKEKNQKIEVSDDGDGMSFEDINERFLRIGRNRRKEGFIKSPSGKRKATGKKGLGKLAFFGIGKTILIDTIKSDSGKKTTFTLDWAEILKTHDVDYEPHHTETKCSKKLKGTTVKLYNLNKKLDFNKEELAIELSKLFNFANLSFKVYVSSNNDTPFLVHNKLKYKNIDAEFEWKFPSFGKTNSSAYSFKSLIKGRIISTKKPIKPGLRGISLFANGRLVNAQEFFGVSESSHAYSYLTGWLDVDFVDDWTEDVISTDRQTLNWNIQETSELRNFLRKCMSSLEKDWHDRRNKARADKIKKITKVDITSWYERLPKEVLGSLKPIMGIVERSKLPEDDKNTTTIVQKLHELIPEYPYFHWRHLHSNIQDVSEIDYKKEDYYRAAQEAVKKYVKEVQKKSKAKNSSGKSLDGKDLMFNAFGSSNGILKFTKNKTQSEKDLEDGQQHLSAGVVSGFRNPTSHENKGDLHPKIFSDKDCLDILSLASYLFTKLDKSRKKR